jgi:uncharacterized repeat protein (TIGR04138 family)
MSTSSPVPMDLHEIVAMGPYPIEAFNFVREGLSYTAERVHGGDDSGIELDRHVSGRELCLGLRDFAVEQYGYLAPTVLRQWRICRTEDFGRIVFTLIEHGYMSKTDEDTLEDFRGVFDFSDGFSDEALRRRLGRD